MKWILDGPTLRRHQNPFIGAHGIQEPVIPGEPSFFLTIYFIPSFLVSEKTLLLGLPVTHHVPHLQVFISVDIRFE